VGVGYDAYRQIVFVYYYRVFCRHLSFGSHLYFMLSTLRVSLHLRLLLALRASFVLRTSLALRALFALSRDIYRCCKHISYLLQLMTAKRNNARSANDHKLQRA